MGYTYLLVLGVLLPTLPSWLSELPVAHRGLHGEGVPENSRAAVAAARRAGFAAEVDVQLTMDGEVVVFHDTTTKRLTERKLSVAGTHYLRLRKLHLAGTAERIPTLHEILQEARGEVPLLIELKPGPQSKKRAEALVRQLRAYRGPVALQSFDPAAVRWWKKHTPLPAGLISGRYRDPSLEKYLRRGLEALWAAEPAPPADFHACDVKRLTEEQAGKLRARGPLLTWTVDSPEKLALAQKWGANPIFEGSARAALS